MSEATGLSASAPPLVSGPVTLLPDPDTDLVRRAAQGELESFDALVRKHQRPLFGYVYRMCGNSPDAEEMVQQALIRAWQGLKGFRGQSSFKTWLYRIATNLCINRVTRRKPLVEIPETLPAPRTDEPVETLRRKVVDELVQQALDKLPADQRAALVMVTYDDLSYKEVAHALGKTPKAIDSLLVRARRNMRELLEPARAKGQI
jgi:RNA polymerase sigma-70 factor, ECF subfamily